MPPTRNSSRKQKTLPLSVAGSKSSNRGKSSAPKRSAIRPLEVAFARQTSSQDIGAAVSISSDDKSDADVTDSGDVADVRREPKKRAVMTEESGSEPMLKKRRVLLAKPTPPRATPFDNSVHVQAVVAKPGDDFERESLNVNDRRWKKQCDIARKRMGDLPPVHGEGQNEIHLLLRVFDLSYEYGPCAGVTRLERWRRAKAMSLNPPDEICQILETKQGTFDDSYKQSVLYREV